MACPNCKSTKTYRKEKKSLTRYCDDCGHKWRAAQPLEALAERFTYKKTTPKGKHRVSIWYCPIDPTKYSFAIGYGGGVWMPKEFEENEFVSGSYDTIEEAIEAGIKEVHNDMQRLLLCDIDDTLTGTISGAKFKQHSRDIKILNGADKALEHYQKENWIIIGISNQGGIGAGHKSLEEAVAEMRYTLELFPQLLCIYICPDFKGEECYCITRRHHLEIGAASKYKGEFRKPNSGMLLHALAAHDGDKAKSWYIGDRPEDEEAATNAGIHFMTADLWRDRFTTGVYTV